VRCSGPGGKVGPGGQLELAELAAVQANSGAEVSSAQCSGRTAGSFGGCLTRLAACVTTGVGGRRLWAAAVPGGVGCRTGDALTDGGARDRRSACWTSSWSDAILPRLSVATFTMPVWAPLTRVLAPLHDPQGTTVRAEFNGEGFSQQYSRVTS